MPIASRSSPVERRPGAPVYLFDLVRDCPRIGGVAEFAARLSGELSDQLGPRLVSVRAIAGELGCGDAAEPYLDRERRAILRLAEIADPAATFLIPNFQSPLPRRPGMRRPRVVNVVHDIQFVDLPELFTPSQRRWLHEAFEETRANADQVVFVSGSTRDAFLQAFGAPRRHAVISPPIRAIAPVPGVDGRAPYLLAVQHSSCHPHKNVGGLLDLFAELATRRPGLELRVTGQGRASFEAELARLPPALRSRVRHHGFVERRELDGLYGGARALVSMSRHEGFNMAAAEAARHGVPLILSDLPAHRELFADVACLLDPAAPSVEAALAYLQAREGAAPPVWSKADRVGVEAVGRAYARLIEHLDRAEASSLRLGAPVGARAFGRGLDHRSARPASRTDAVAVHGASVRRGRVARALLAGTMLSVLGGLASALAPNGAQAAAGAPPVPGTDGAGNGGKGGDAIGLAGTGGAGGTFGGNLNGGDGTGSYFSGPPAATYFGGGGGGASGVTGGTGGSGGGPAAAGGQGGQGPSPSNLDGAPGTDVHMDPSGGTGQYLGGGGGGGGAHYFVGPAIADPSGYYAGGSGGRGGYTDLAYSVNGNGSGGGGGGGGYGAIVTGGGTNMTTNFVGGGRGGFGGEGGIGTSANGGSGGNGGIGVFFTTAGAHLDNSGTIQGGYGGGGGQSNVGGAGGSGGIGVVFTGNGANLVNSGAIQGGYGGLGGGGPSIGGDGGNGGIAVVFTTAGARLDNSGTIQGGAGGDGFLGGGGAGGEGGIGVLFTSNGANLVNEGSIQGGEGGEGGPGGGIGGAGGIGVFFATGGSEFINSGTVQGGNGGSNSFEVASNAPSGLGGDGIVGSDLHITNFIGTKVGSISGGLSGDGTTQANAINFTAGANRLTLEGSGISGNINVGTSAATPTSLTFDQTAAVALFSSITGTGSIIDSGTGPLTLFAPNTYAGGTRIDTGATLIAASADEATNITSFGSGPITFNGGTLGFYYGGGPSDPILNNALVLNAAGGTIDIANANPLYLAGPITDGVGAGALTLIDSSGTSALYIGTPGGPANTYSGGTILGSAATPPIFVGLVSSNALGTGSLTFAGPGSTLDLAGFDQTVTALNGATGTITNFGTGNPSAVTLSTLRVASGTFGGTITDGSGAFGPDGATAIVGTIGLVKTSAGTLVLSGANTYSGGTTINAGTLSLAHATAGRIDAAGTGAITLIGGAIETGVTGTLDLPITVAKTASAGIGATAGTTATLTGPLTLGAGSTLQFGSLVDTGTVVLAPATPPTIAASTNLVLAAGTLQAGAGNAALGVLTGTAAATTVNGGTLDFNGNAATIANLQGSGGTVTNAAGATTTINAGSFAGALAGAGGVTKATGGALLLTGVSTFTGATSVTAGTLEIGAGGAITQSASLDNAATFQIDPGGSATFVTATSSGTVLASGTLNATTFTNTGAFTVTGPLGGSIATFANAAGATLAVGANRFSGITALVNDGRVSVNGGSLAATTITNDAGAVFRAAGTLDVATLSNSGSFTVTGPLGGSISAFNQIAGTTDLGDNSVSVVALALTGGTIQNGTLSAGAFGVQAGTVSAVLAGPGPLTKTGAGTVTLSGVNTYTGTTTITGGTLALVGAGGIAASSGVVDNAVLDISGTDAGASLTTLSGSGAVALGAQTLTLTAAGDTFSGTIGGSGAVALTGGREVLTGTNAYTGGTQLAGGVLGVGSAAALGSGPITFSGGTLQAVATGLDIANPAVLQGDGTIDTRAFDLTYSGPISGPGILTKLGAGVLTLDGDNAYQGGTQLNAGSIAISSNTALGTGTIAFNGGGLTVGRDGLVLGNAISLEQGASLDTSTGTLTLNGTIFGPGALTKLGAGTLVLDGASTYSGGTLLRAGTIAVGGDSALGSGPLSMDDNTTLAFTANLTLANPIVFTGVADPTFDTGSNTDIVSGPISGPGALTKLGSGTLILTGTDTYTGATTVAAGALIVDGSVANSTVTIGTGALLGGSGTVGGVIAGAGATLAPGARTPFGALEVGGNLTLAAGSTLRINIDAGGQTDQVVAGGTATLGGGRVDVVAASGGYASATQYQFLRAAGGVNGSFGSLTTTSNLAFLAPSLTYAPTSVTLVLSRNQATFASLAATANQAATANAIAGLGPNSPLNRAVLGQTQQGARQAFDAASGEAHASVPTAAVASAQFVSTFVFDRLWNVVGSGLDARQLLDKLGPGLPAGVQCYAPIPGSTAVAPVSYTLYGEGFGDFGHTGGNGNASSFDRSLGGFVIGGDTLLTGLGTPWRIGLVGGYTHDDFSARDRSSSGTFESVFGSLYGGARYGNIDVRLGAGYGGNNTDANRQVLFPGFAEAEHANYGGSTVQGFTELGYRFQFPRAVIEPVAGAAVIHVHQDSFRESGGAAALIGFARDTDIETTTLGVRGEAAPFRSLPLVARAFLGWKHAYGDVDPKSVLAFVAGSTPFTTSGAPIDRDTLASEFGLEYQAAAAWTVGLSYIGQVGERAYDNSVKGRVEYRF